VLGGIRETQCGSELGHSALDDGSGGLYEPWLVGGVEGGAGAAADVEELVTGAYGDVNTGSVPPNGFGIDSGVDAEDSS